MNMSKLEAEVDRLSSVHEIQQLVYRHAYSIDSCDLALFQSLWAETETALEPPYADYHSARSPRIAFEGRGPSMIAIANHLIDFDGPHDAHGTVYGLVQTDWSGKFLEQAVIYQDRYVRVEEQWLFLNRKHLLLYGAERSANPFAQPPANWPANQIGLGTATDEIRGT